jgi:hypothetical protein
VDKLKEASLSVSVEIVGRDDCVNVFLGSTVVVTTVIDDIDDMSVTDDVSVTVIPVAGAVGVAAELIGIPAVADGTMMGGSPFLPDIISINGSSKNRKDNKVRQGAYRFAVFVSVDPVYGNSNNRINFQ